MRGGKKNKKKRMIRQMLNWNTDVVLAYNVLYWRRARIVVPKFSICTMLNSSTTAQFITYACLLPIHCCTLFFFGIQHFTNYFKNIFIISLKKFAVSNKSIIFVLQNQTTMRTIKISELKVGDKLPDCEPSKYGQYVDWEINSIRVTKGGRYVITTNRTYIGSDGVRHDRQFNMHYSNGALSGNTEITVL